jgi:hypothetical protein
MSQPPRPNRRAITRLSVWVTIALIAGASALGASLTLALKAEDIEAIESPLLLAVARQLDNGPCSLYGPYDGHHPLVLIHAPLYYRLAALAALPLRHAGLTSITAALVGGRSLSSLGFLITLVAAYRLARLRGLPRSAGRWAALLAAATPVYGGLPFEVRPDMLGIGLQTTGILLVLGALVSEPIGESKLVAAFAGFALAACIKQQFVMAPLVSVLLLLGAWARGRLGLMPIARCVVVTLAIVLLYYGAEQWLTGGRMSRSVFLAAGSVRRVHPSTWSAAGSFLLVLMWKCVGVILLLAAAGLSLVAVQPGLGRKMLFALGTLLVVLVVVSTGFQLVSVNMRVGELIVLGLILVIVLVIPACALLERSRWFGSLEAALWAYAAAELAVTAVLSRLSTGAWYNYAIEAVVLGCVLTGRSIARAMRGAASWHRLFPIAVGVLAVPAFAFTDVTEVIAKRRADKAQIARLLDSVQRPSSEIFFVDLPGENRIHGRLDLVYDPWLYPVFESIGLAEPRSVWLEQAVADGPVRIVVAASGQPKIDGLNRTLPELGYRAMKRIGRFIVWTR